MYIEWKPENKEIREGLLYCQELYIHSFSRALFLSKGNLTSMRAIYAFAEEAQTSPLKYIFIYFMNNSRLIRNTGIRYINSDGCKKQVIRELLYPKWLGAGTTPIPIYDRVIREIKPYIREKYTPVEVIDHIMREDLSVESFLYMTKVDILDTKVFKDVISMMSTSNSIALQKVNLWTNRGVLPNDKKYISEYTDFHHWCLQES